MANPESVQLISCLPTSAKDSHVVSRAKGYRRLESLALARLESIISPPAAPGVKLFPTAYHTFFIHGLEEDIIASEYDWVNHLLYRFPERGTPREWEKVLNQLAAENSVLASWPRYRATLALAVEPVKTALKSAMDLHFPRAVDSCAKSDYLRDPINYRTETRAIQHVWNRALHEVSTLPVDADADAALLQSFLEVHALLKDPVGSLHPEVAAAFPRQLRVFQRLYSQLASVPSPSHPNHELLSKKLMAQLAYESSYLALSDLQDLAFLVISGTEQLAYIYADIDTLPRAEFSRPDRLFDVMQELVSSKIQNDGTLYLPPIAIARVPSLDRDEPSFHVIIDGNNRSTSTCMLRFLAAYPDPSMVRVSDLERYCRSRNLGPKWLCDLRDGLTSIMSQNLLEILRPHWLTVRSFAHISELPALLVQEENFMTMCMRAGTREAPVLMQPVHQSIYNDDRFCASFRAKAGQVCYTSPGFRLARKSSGTNFLDAGAWQVSILSRSPSAVGLDTDAG